MSMIYTIHSKNSTLTSVKTCHSDLKVFLVDAFIFPQNLKFIFFSE